MSRIVLVLLVIAAVFTAGSSAQQCGPNEEFKSCGSACEPTCAKPKSDCIEECVMGCQCKNGFVKKDGRCVLLRDC